MASTTNYALPFIEAAQAQKHVTHNDALTRLDATLHVAVENRTLTSPPGSPADGAAYLLASGATGAWTGWDNQIASWRDGAWLRIIPRSGMKAWVKAERLTVTYEDGAWRDGIALTARGGRVTLRAKEEEVTLTGSFVDTTDAAFIPNRAIVLSVAARTTLAITGATSYNVGVAGDTSKFGGTLGASLGSSNVGSIGPTAYYADTRVRVSANGGAFTAGKVRLIVYFIEMAAPTS